VTQVSPQINKTGNTARFGKNSVGLAPLDKISQEYRTLTMTGVTQTEKRRMQKKANQNNLGGQKGGWDGDNLHRQTPKKTPPHPRQYGGERGTGGWSKGTITQRPPWGTWDYKDSNREKI